MTETPVGDSVVQESTEITTEARVFTQEQVDRIVQDRLARVKVTPPPDYEELKAAKTRLDEIEAANRTELENAQRRIADLERQTSEAAQRAQDHLVRSAIVSEAAKRNVVDPDAAVALIDRASITFDEDGHPTNIATAMDSLLETRTYLVAQQGGGRGNADQGARGGSTPVGQLSRADLQSMTSAEIVKAQAEGRLQNVLVGET